MLCLIMFEIQSKVTLQVVKVQPNKTPEVVSEHQCIGNACEEQMVLNEMAEGTDVTFVVKETHGCMIETV